MVRCNYQQHAESLSGARVGAMKFQRRVLCAEGHQDTRELLVIWLGLAGYEVTSCDTVAEVVARGSLDRGSKRS